MNAATTEKIQAYLHTWTDINPEQNRDNISFEERGGNWTNRPVSITVPDGWYAGKSGGGAVVLYNASGRHVQIVRIADHGKSVEVASADGVTWLPLCEA